MQELCTGGDLGKVVKKCKSDRTSLDERVIWKVLAQSIVALKDCHRRKENGELKPILHRDIKIGNHFSKHREAYEFFMCSFVLT